MSWPVPIKAKVYLPLEYVTSYYLSADLVRVGTGVAIPINEHTAILPQGFYLANTMAFSKDQGRSQATEENEELKQRAREQEKRELSGFNAGVGCAVAYSLYASHNFVLTTEVATSVSKLGKKTIGSVGGSVGVGFYQTAWLIVGGEEFYSDKGRPYLAFKAGVRVYWDFLSQKRGFDE